MRRKWTYSHRRRGRPSIPVGTVSVILCLAPGALAIVWTEVIAWGSQLFEGRLADAFAAPWPKTVEQFVHTLDPIVDNGRFTDLQIRRHRFERELDADNFVAVTQTYGGTHTAEPDGIGVGTTFSLKV